MYILRQACGTMDSNVYAGGVTMSSPTLPPPVPFLRVVEVALLLLLLLFQYCSSKLIADVCVYLLQHLVTMASRNVCLVGMHFERPGAPRVYSRNTSVWSEYELARKERYSSISTTKTSSLGEVEVKYIPEKPLRERLAGLSSLHISKVRRII